MIDLDDLERNLNWYESRIKNPEPGVIYHLDYNERGALRELLGRLREADADAKRYRWLRDELDQSQGSIALFDGCCHVCDIDLFIDEAMNHEVSDASDRVEP
jgi:hypothetical protein